MECKNKFEEIEVLIFCERNGNTSGFCLVLSRHIHNSVKQIIFKNNQRLNAVKYL